MAQLDIEQLLAQAQAMQEQLLSAQKELSDIEVSSSVGGGMVKVTATADLHLTSITIDPDALDPNDVEMLQDMILAAVNDVLESAQTVASQQVSSVTGGINIPGLM